MHEDVENSRKFKLKFRAGNQRITNFETFQLAVLIDKVIFGVKEVLSLFFNR